MYALCLTLSVILTFLLTFYFTTVLLVKSMKWKYENDLEGFKELLKLK